MKPALAGSLMAMKPAGDLAGKPVCGLAVKPVIGLAMKPTGGVAMNLVGGRAMRPDWKKEIPSNGVEIGIRKVPTMATHPVAVQP